MNISVKDISILIEELFVKNGLGQSDASIVTNCLLEAELAGISTHGVSMIPSHIKKCKKGYNLNAQLLIEKETPSFTLYNADNAIGMISAWKCIKRGVEMSSNTGIHAVFCNNANTFSAAYCYVKYAVDNGKIAIVMSNAPAQMAPLGGKNKMLGTNPLAIGIPTNDNHPFILDMATSAVAKSKINEAVILGKKEIPYGWATDSEGNPTNNPNEAIKGLILPMAGPKGYGLSMAIDILAGLLSRAAFLNGVNKFYSEDNECMNVGHVFFVIDPVVLYGNDFYQDMHEYLNTIRNSEPIKGQKIYVPGDLNYLSREQKIRDGLYITDELYELLVNNTNIVND